MADNAAIPAPEIVATEVRVTDVAGDETFTATPDDGGVLAISLTEQAESPFVVQSGQIVSFSGTTAAVDRTLPDGRRLADVNVAYHHLTIVR